MRLVFDDRGAEALEIPDGVHHAADGFARMPQPVIDLPNDPQWLAGAVGLCGIAREPLIGQVRVVFEAVRRLDDIDAPAPSGTRERNGKLGTPNRRLEEGREVDVAEHSGSLVV